MLQDGMGPSRMCAVLSMAKRMIALILVGFFGSHQGTVKRTKDQDAGTAVWGAAAVAQCDRWRGTAAWLPQPWQHQSLGTFYQKRVAWEKLPCGAQAPFAEIN